MVEFLRALYDASDIDGDGVLSEAELDYGRLLAGETALGVMRGRPPSGNMDTRRLEGGSGAMVDFRRDVDVNGDGRASCGELVAAMGMVLPPWARHGFSKDSQEVEGLLVACNRADVDGDGDLSTVEIHFASLASYELFASMLAERVLGAFDEDGDRAIDEREVARSGSRRSEDVAHAIAMHAQEVFPSELTRLVKWMLDARAHQ